MKAADGQEVQVSIADAQDLSVCVPRCALSVLFQMLVNVLFLPIVPSGVLNTDRSLLSPTRTTRTRRPCRWTATTSLSSRSSGRSMKTARSPLWLAPGSATALVSVAVYDPRVPLHRTACAWCYTGHAHGAMKRCPRWRERNGRVDRRNGMLQAVTC